MKSLNKLAAFGIEVLIATSTKSKQNRHFFSLVSLISKDNDKNSLYLNIPN